MISEPKLTIVDVKDYCHPIHMTIECTTRGYVALNGEIIPDTAYGRALIKYVYEQYLRGDPRYTFAYVDRYGNEIELSRNDYRNSL